MEFTERSLILKVGRFREIDLWVRLATPTHGVLTAFAFGGAKSRKRFLGCLDPFNQVQFRFKTSPRSGYLCLMEGLLLTGHRELRTDQQRLGQAANCLKFYEKALDSPGENKTGYELLSQSLSFLEEHPTVSPLFPVMFRAKLAFLLGYEPNLMTCPHCGKDLMDSVAPVFQVEIGRAVCGSCATPGGRRIPLGNESLKALRLIQREGPATWGGLLPSPVARRQLYDAVDALVRYHLGLAWKDGAFRPV